MTDPLEDALSVWKKLVRDTSRPIRYSDAFRDGWRAAEWHNKRKEKTDGSETNKRPEA